MKKRITLPAMTYGVFAAVGLALNYQSVLSAKVTLLLSLVASAIALLVCIRDEATFPVAKKLRPLGALFWFFVGLVCLRQLRNILDLRILSGTIPTLLDTVLAFCLGVSVLLPVIFSNRPATERVYFLAMFLGCYSGINILGSFLGAPIYSGHEAEIAGIGAGGTRMEAPFGAGLNQFGASAAVGMCLAFSLLVNSFRQFGIVDRLIIAILFGVQILACALVQIRAAAIALVVAVILCTLPLRWAKVFGSLVVLFSIAASALFINLIAVDALTAIVPAEFDKVIGRSADEIITGGGRAYIFDMGWKKILSLEVPIFGEGLIVRDSSSAISDGSTTNYGMSYHNSALDSFMVYGPVFGSLFVGGLLVLIFKLNASKQWKMTWVIICSIWSVSITESISNTSLFWWLMLFEIALVAKIEHNQIKT